ncbi:MAG: lipopolysaccharide biosynthesis protein, partial [Bacteroidales bacterium]|nr:lipopolysaccharide biosynthesis protein [Bacteroidales bacterium]
MEAVLKLVIVYLLLLSPFDNLKLYAVLMLGITLTVTLIYRIWCKRKYSECAFTFYWDKTLLHSLFSYSGWNMIGAVAVVTKNHGVNILLNIFFGPIVNTARAVAFQIYGAITQFVNNLYISSRPQITKYYAQNETTSMWNLVFRSTKLAYFLFMTLSIPFFTEVEYILILWLGYIPEYTPLIMRLILIEFMLDSMTKQLVVVLQAANK